MRRLILIGLFAASLSCGCGKANQEQPAEASRTTDSARLLSLRAAEYARDPTKITRLELSSRRLDVRRQASRALARIGGPSSLELLQYALHDDDSEVVAWAAWGLGRLCHDGAARELSLALVSRAGSLVVSSPKVESVIDPFYAIASALGRCATDEAESALRSWLQVNPALARQATLGLDTLASTRQRLDTSTLVALLDAADRQRAFAIATLPLTRLVNLDPVAARRLVTLAPRLLESSGDERRFLIRALERAGDDAISILKRIVQDDAQYRATERAEALRVLANQGEAGQRVLGEVLVRVTRPDESPNLARFVGAEWAVLFELMSDLKVEGRANREQLARLAQFSAGTDPSPAMALRLDWMRCKAARLLAGTDLAYPLLQSCASLPGARQRKLAELEILGSAWLRGSSLRRLETLLEDQDVVVRMEALKLLARHEEFTTRPERLALALADPALGVVATAADLLKRTPELALRRERPNPELMQALERAAMAKWPEDAIELRSSLVDAIGSLGLLSAKAKVVEACLSTIPRLRESAEAALKRLGEPNRRCTGQPSPAPLMPALPEGVRTLVFKTDLGELELRLDATLAPFAVERLLTLAKSGFYDNLAVHRMVPGFVVQFGDQGGDGYGGAGLRPLPCEPSPVPFTSGDVGMALSGLDSGSSQFFVTLGPYPQLGIEYTKVGRAGPGWDRLTVGDVIRKVEVAP